MAASEVLPPSYGEPDENGFVGVSPEYSNAGNSVDEPLEADGDDLDTLNELGVNNQWEVSEARETDSDPTGDEGGTEGDSTQGGQKEVTKTERKSQTSRLAAQQKASTDS